MVLLDLPLFPLFKGKPPWVPLAHGRQHSWLWLWDLPQAASPGLPGRSKTWGRGCRRGGIYTSGSGRGSPRRTGTWAQRRNRHKSEDLYAPEAERRRP